MSDPIEDIIKPLLLSAGINKNDVEILKKGFRKQFFTEALSKALASLLVKDQELLNDKLGKEDTVENKFLALLEFLKDHKEAEKALEFYLKEELPDRIEKLIAGFITQATPEQRENFLNLLNKTNTFTS